MGSPAHTGTLLAQSSDSELRPRQSDSRDAPSISQWHGHKELTPLLRSQGLRQICTPHLLLILTKPACHQNSFCGGRCDSNQAHTISLKPCIISRRFRLTSFDTHHISSHLFFSLLLMVHHSQFPGDFGYISYISTNPCLNFSRLPIFKNVTKSP